MRVVDVGNLGIARPTAPAAIPSAIDPDLHRMAEGWNVPDIRADPHVTLRPSSVGTPPTDRGPFRIIRASDEVEQVSLPTQVRIPLDRPSREMQGVERLSLYRHVCS